MALPNKQQRRQCFRLLSAALLVVLSEGAAGSARAGEVEFRVIAHPSNAASSFERAFVADLFLKKVTRWSDGEAAKPVDLRPTSAARKRFSESVLKRSVGAVRSYWQQRIFSGRDVPPPELESDEAVVAYVARSPGAIGYVSGNARLAGVRELGIH